MSQEPDISKLKDHLQSLDSALEQREPKEALALLRVLRMNGLKDETSADLVSVFSAEPDANDYERAQQWVRNHLDTLEDQFDELGLFDEFDDFNPFDEANFVSVGEDISDFEDSDADVFLSIDADSEELPDSFPPSEEVLVDDFFGLEESSPTPGHSRERTRQFDPQELRALSNASAPEENEVVISDEIEVDFALGSSISTPLDEIDPDSAPELDDVDIHEQPTRDAFRAPSLDELFPSTEKALPADQLQASMEAETRDEFDFQFEAEPGASQPDSAEEFDFDLGPDSSAPGDQNTGDDFSFDFDELSQDHIAVESSVFEDDDDAKESDSPPEDDFDFDFGLGAGKGSELLQQGDPFGKDMGYADPAGDEPFFPPPLNAGATPEPVDHQSSPGEPPETKKNLRQERTTDRVKSVPRPRKRQQTPLVTTSDFNSTIQAEETPARGTTPLPPDSSNLNPASTSSGISALNEEEFRVLGQELSQAGEDSSVALQQDEESDRYRGEPVIRELGNEPTPSHEDVAPSGAAPFTGVESGAEQTNPFAQDAPTGVGNEPLPSMDASSFFLEEVDKPDSEANSAQAAVSETLDRARALYEMASFEEALELLEAILDVDDSCEPAHELLSLVTGELKRAQKKRLGSLSATPTLSIAMNHIASLDIDHRAGFLLSQIDGILTFEDILDMSAMDRLETLTLLVELLENQVIKVD